MFLSLMNDLIEHIREGVTRKGHRNVFDHVLDEWWPIKNPGDRQAQQAEIAKFAAQHGWRVTFLHGGKWARFQPATPS